MAVELGGEVEGGHAREFGRAEIEILADSKLFEGVWERGRRYPVWMSHGDRVTALPAGFRAIAASENAPAAAIADEARRLYGVQFHLEVVHTPDGAKILSNFVHKVAGLKGRLDDGRLPSGGDRCHPRQGRRRPRALRPFRRGRFGGRGGAHPRGDRRAAHLRLRRPRPVAAGRGGRGRRPLPRPLQYPARACGGRGSVPRGARRHHRSRDEAQDHRPPVHRGFRRARRRRSPRTAAGRRNFWPRARSIPT